MNMKEQICLQHALGVQCLLCVQPKDTSTLSARPTFGHISCFIDENDANIDGALVARRARPTCSQSARAARVQLGENECAPRVPNHKPQDTGSSAMEATNIRSIV